MSSFEAKFGGYCGACDERIRPGDVCAYSEDVVVHEDCEASAPPAERVRPVCSRCFMETAANGLCGCDA